MALRFLGSILLVGSLLAGCKLELGSPPFLSEKGAYSLYVATTDYHTGQLASLNLKSRVAQLNFASIHSDAVLKNSGNLSELFVINRLGADNIQRIDSFTGKTLQQFSVGLGRNPQDLWVSEGIGYVTCFKEPQLLRFDMTTGNALEAIDLSPFADADGSPEATLMRESEGFLAIQLQRLDQMSGFLPSGSSQIVFWDLKKKKWAETLTLLATNPVTGFKDYINGRWLVGEAGRVAENSALDGGIEQIDPWAKKSLGFITTEVQLGGDIVDFECVSSQRCVAVISKPETQLVTFDPHTGARLDTLWISSGYHLQQVLWDQEEQLLYVVDSNPRDPGIRVWSSQSLVSRLDLGWQLELPPYRIILQKH